MNRREFLKSALFTTIGAVVLSAFKKVTTGIKSYVDKVSTKKYKNLDISLIGFGAMRLPQKDGEPDIEKTQEMVDYAMKNGINYYVIVIETFESILLPRTFNWSRSENIGFMGVVGNKANVE